MATIESTKDLTELCDEVRRMADKFNEWSNDKSLPIDLRVASINAQVGMARLLHSCIAHLESKEAA